MKPDKIILHHSLTKDSRTVSWGAIRDYHINHNGWSDIGYHFGIEMMNWHAEIICGRMPDIVGAHCRSHNLHSIGVCFIGNFDLYPPSKLIWYQGIKLVKYLMSEFNINQIVGHTELNSHKTCPGKMFDLDKFREELFF